MLHDNDDCWLSFRRRFLFEIHYIAIRSCIADYKQSCSGNAGYIYSVILKLATWKSGRGRFSYNIA